jgi:hypothetical protein
MGEARPIVVGGAVDENLCLVFKAAETAAVQYAVAVALKTGTNRMIQLRVNASEAAGAVRGVRDKVARFKFFPFLPGMCHGGILA